jgi:Holliday junction resolvasome RuvABC ATP-dependent DNA helicase subunit
MIVFIDEVHALRNNIVQGLLKAVERSDGQLVTEKRMTANTHNVLWMIATTDRGLLFDAFDSRFSKVSLELYTQEEIAQIVSLNFPEWNDQTCRLVAHYCGIIPRESLAFAHEMQLERNMTPNSWDVVAAKVAEDNGIDPHGLAYQRLHIITSLGQNGPVSANRMQYVANCKEEELKSFVMPYLMTKTKDRPSLVTVTNKGYCVTEEGLMELDKRGIYHIGEAALPPKPKLPLKATGTTGLTYVP